MNDQAYSKKLENSNRNKNLAANALLSDNDLKLSRFITKER